MAGRGPAPTGSARRRNKQPPGVEVKTPAGDAAEVYGPELGPRPGYITVKDKITGEPMRVKLRWLAVTREWWEAWRRAPQASTLLATDWLELRTTALLVDDLYRGETKNASEVRLRVAKFGATLEDRQRLRMTFGSPTARPNTGGTPPAPPRDEVSSARERRERIAQRAAGGDA